MKRDSDNNLWKIQVSGKDAIWFLLIGLQIAGFLGIIFCITVVIKSLISQKPILWDRIIIALAISITLSLLGLMKSRVTRTN